MWITDKQGYDQILDAQTSTPAGSADKVPPGATNLHTKLRKTTLIQRGDRQGQGHWPRVYFDIYFNSRTKPQVLNVSAN